MFRLQGMVLEIIDDIIITFKGRTLREYDSHGGLIKEFKLDGPTFHHNIYGIKYDKDQKFYLLYAFDHTYKYSCDGKFIANSPPIIFKSDSDYGPYEIINEEVRLAGQLLATFDQVTAIWPNNGNPIVVGNKKIGLFLSDGRFAVRTFDRYVFCEGMFSNYRLLISFGNGLYDLVEFIR